MSTHANIKKSGPGSVSDCQFYQGLIQLELTVLNFVFGDQTLCYQASSSEECCQDTAEYDCC